MKTFVSDNWYKLLVSLSLLIASVGFLIQSASPAIAKNSNITQNRPIIWVSSGGYAHAIAWRIGIYDEAFGEVVGKVRLQ